MLSQDVLCMDLVCLLVVHVVAHFYVKSHNFDRVLQN